MTAPGPPADPARSPLPAETAVAIVGAGPTGLALAVTLAAAGVDFVLLDKLAEGAGTSRAAVVHARTLEVMDGLGVSGALLERGLRLERFTIRQGRRALVRLSFAGLPTPHPYLLMVPQCDTEAVLLDRLRALGGGVHRGREVTAVAQDLDGVTLTTADGARLRARYAVGADGMHSVVRRAAGTGFTGSAYAEAFVLADVRMDWLPGRAEVSLNLHPDGMVVVAPLPGGRFRVVAAAGPETAGGREAGRHTGPDAEPGPEPGTRPCPAPGTAPGTESGTEPGTEPGTESGSQPAGPDRAWLQRLMDTRQPGQAHVHSVVWASRFRVHHRIADAYQAGRLLLAGDAAHVHSPAGGQGMNTGIQDAYALGRALAEGRLGTYGLRRRPVAVRVVAFTDRLTRMATMAPGPARAARDAVLPVLGRVPALRRRVTRELAELDYR